MLFRKTNASISCIPMRTGNLPWPFMKRNQILSNFDSKQNEGYNKCIFSETNASISCIPMRTTHVLRTNFDSKQNECYKCFFRETNASISCIQMRTIHLSWSLMKRNQILATDEVRPVLRINFDSKQNKCYKCFFRKTNASILCMPLRTTHLSRPLMKRNQILSTNEVHPVLRTNIDSKIGRASCRERV